MSKYAKIFTKIYLNGLGIRGEQTVGIILHTTVDYTSLQLSTTFYVFAVLAIIYYNWCNNNKNNNDSMFTGNQGNLPVTHYRNVFRFCMLKQRHKMSKTSNFWSQTL